MLIQLRRQMEMRRWRIPTPTRGQDKKANREKHRSRAGQKDKEIKLSRWLADDLIDLIIIDDMH